MYLWNDAFKYNHDRVFRSEYRTLEHLLQGFAQSLFGIFSEEIIFPHNVPAGTDAIEGDGAAENGGDQ